MPGVSGEPAVTILVCSFYICMRGCGRIAPPAFPAPSDFRAKKVFRGQTSRELRGEIAEARLLFSPPPTRSCVAGRGRGWGVLQRTHQEFDSRRRPHPRPLPATQERVGGG